MKVLRQHFLIRADLTNGTKFDYGINLQFIPDEFIVREVNYNCNNGERGTFYVKTDLLKDGNNSTLCMFNFSRNDASNVYVNHVSTPNSIFNLSNVTNKGTYNFQIFDSLDTNNPPTLNGDLLIHLEFVKRTK
jgi:hypothetical protein